MASSPISRRVLVIGGEIDRSLVERVINGEFEIVRYGSFLTGKGAYLSALVDGGRARAVFVREDSDGQGTWIFTAMNRGIPIYRFNDTGVYRWRRNR